MAVASIGDGHPQPLTPIPGTGKLEHLEENMAAATLNLSDEDFRSL